MLIIRADGNAKIGAGHLMRCLAIAEEVRRLYPAHTVEFWCADEESAKLASDCGFETKVFGTGYERMEEELPKWKQWITDDKNTILVDSYHVTDVYLAFLGQFGRVCLMDDMQERAYPVDMVINYNLYADRAVYESLYGEHTVQFCLGGSYVPLRKQFQNTEACYQTRDSVQQVLLTTGAGDVDNIAGEILDRIYSKKFVFHVLLGRFSPHLETWKLRAAECPNIQVHYDVKDMAGLMKKCDLAITAGGSTVYELSAARVPFIGFAYAPNQEKLVQCLEASGGNWHLDKKGTLDRIEHFFGELQDCDKRNRISERAWNKVDGHGAEKLAKTLVEA